MIKVDVAFVEEGTRLCVHFSEAVVVRGNQVRLNCGQGDETFSLNANEPNKVDVQGGSVAVTYGSANSAPKLALEPSGK